MLKCFKCDDNSTAGVTCGKLVFDIGRGLGGVSLLNGYDMAVHANDSSYSVVLDVRVILLASIHGKSRCLMTLLGRM
jgi:hypothetical protein